MKNKRHIMILLMGAISLLYGRVCFSQSVALGSLYAGANRMSLDSRYNIMDPAWGGQLGLNLKVGAKWIQFDYGLELNVKGLKMEYSHDMEADTGRKLESNNSITSYAVHTTIPVGVSLGYYSGDYEGCNIEGGSIVGGGFIDLGIWGQNWLKQSNVLSNRHSTIMEESNIYTQNCFGKSSIQRKRFDAGIYFGVALTTSVIGVSVIYRKGLLNLSNVDGCNYTSNGLFINLSYNFTYED